MGSKEKSKRKLRRPRFRFSLGFFCLFVLLCGTILGYWASRVRPLQKQWADAQPLVESDFVHIETTPADLPGWMLALMPENERGYIESVQVRGDWLTESEENTIEAITKLPRLKVLKLYFCDVDDDDCKKIATLNSLETVQVLGSDRVTDSGIESLLNLSDLKFLEASQTSATWKSHLKLQQLGSSEISLQTNYRGIVKISQRNPDFNEIAKLESPPFTGIAIEAGMADVEGIKKLSNMKELRLYISNDAVSEEMDVLEELLDWNQLDSIVVIPGKQKLASRNRQCSVELFDKIAKLVQNRTNSVDVENEHIAFQLNPVQPAKQSLSVELFSITPDFPKSIAPMPKIENAKIVGNAGFITTMVSVSPNLRKLNLSPAYPGLGPQSENQFANLGKLEDLTIRTTGNYHSLPWDFFENWKSADSMRKIHLKSDKMWDKPSLKPLLEFRNLESLFVQTGRGDGISNHEELKSAIAVEKPNPKAPKEGRFRWLMSTMVGKVKKELTPPKTVQRSGQ